MQANPLVLRHVGANMDPDCPPERLGRARAVLAGLDADHSQFDTALSACLRPWFDKSRNFVLLTTGECAAVDLDAAATVDPSAAAKLGPTNPRLLPCLAGQKPTSSGCLPPEQAAVVLRRRRRAAAIFKHLAAGADELSEAMLNRFCGDVGFDEHDRPELTALDRDGNGQVSACEFAVFFGDLKHEAKLVKFVDSKGSGGG